MANAQKAMTTRHVLLKLPMGMQGGSQRNHPHCVTIYSFKIYKDVVEPAHETLLSTRDRIEVGEDEDCSVECQFG